MFAGKLVFSQVMNYLQLHTFRRDVARYQGERYVKQFRCLDQYLVMAFAQLTDRESLAISQFVFALIRAGFPIWVFDPSSNTKHLIPRPRKSATGIFTPTLLMP